MQIKYFIKNYVPVLLILLIVLGGCSPIRKEKKIEGTWEMVDIIDPPNNKEQWVFEKPTLRRVKLTDSLPPAGIDTGEYSIQVKFFKTFLNVSGLTGSFGFNGKWEIVKLNKKVMIIVFFEETGLLQREFIKIE